MKSLRDFYDKKRTNQKISMVTCYDFWTSCLIERSPVDCILVGDSAAMVMHGHESTVPMTVDAMATHVSAVRRGTQKIIIGDMPFLAHRMSQEKTMQAVSQLMQAGANAVKIEAQPGHEEIIEYVVQSGVPVIGHIGLTPQSVDLLGGYKVQGKNPEAAERLFELAKSLEKAGCFSLVVECVPDRLAQRMSESLSIPVIGIGSGQDVDGQVLVLQDLIGGNSKFKPKFVRQFSQVHDVIGKALTDYHESVVQKTFPSHEEIYH